MFFNGGDRTVGTSQPPEPRYRAIIERVRADSASIAVEVTAEVNDDSTLVRIRTELSIPAGESIPNPSDFTVRALLYENNVTSRSQVFQHVVRTILPGSTLGIGAGGETASVDSESPFDDRWKPGDLRVVAWVQNNLTMEVLNSSMAAVREPVPVETTSWGQIKSTWTARP